MEDWEKFEPGDQPQHTPNYKQEKRPFDEEFYGSVNFDRNTGRAEYVDFGEAPKRKVKEKKPPQYVTKKAFIWSLIVCVVVSAAVGAGSYALAISHFGGTSIDKSVNTTNYNMTAATGSELSIQQIIAKNENSVVAIVTESVSTDTWLRQYVTQGAGSGVIYSEDGYIITNNHVIEDASNIKVTLYNGKTYDAKLIARDAQTDLAVIKIEESNLIPVTLAEMSQASVGDLVVAIGNPLGTLSGTATEGIISALEREITIDGKAMSLIQTSASINPGNSGGGLFDQHGNLIGIVVAKSSGSDVEGLGFAIPVDKVGKVVSSLIENGYVTGRPAAGIKIVDLTNANDAMEYGVSITGVYIAEVTGENAKKAGLQPGDLIYYIDDEKVTSSSMLIKEIQDHEIGDKVTFTIVRENDMKKITVVLEDSSKFNGNDNTSQDSSQQQNEQQGGQQDGGQQDGGQQAPGIGDLWGNFWNSPFSQFFN